MDKLLSILAGETYSYSYDVIAVSSGGSAQASLTIDRDMPFLLTDIRGYAQQNGATAQVNSYLINFRDDTTSKEYFSKPTHAANVLTNTRESGSIHLYMPRLISAKATVTTTVYNTANVGVAIDAYISLVGFKVYNKAMLNNIKVMLGISS